MSGMKRQGGSLLAADINLNRGRDDNLLSHGTQAERTYADQEDRIIEQASTVRNLQNQILHLERQLKRVIQLNPSVSNEVKLHTSSMVEPATEHANHIAQLLSNSTLLKSYESLMVQYEDDCNKKANLITRLERDYQQAITENNLMCEQIYKIKQTQLQNVKGSENQDPNNEPNNIVDLLKRNHDIMMEKYELYRQRNEVLERHALDKEALYVKIKSENDSITDQVYTLKRNCENFSQENAILTQKLAYSEEAAKASREQAFALKNSKDKFEGQWKIVSEQLALVQKSHDDISRDKLLEVELLQKDLNQVGLKDRDSKSRLIQIEKEYSEVKDILRSTSQELDIRTRENDHLLTLLEDQEQKITLYEEKEKQIHALATESKKRIEDANLDRDRVLLKEQSYLTKIARVEDQLKREGAERTERHDRVVESLRQKHRTQLQQKCDEISDLTRKVSDNVEIAERMIMDRDALREEVHRLQEQWRSFKEDTSSKYEHYNKQINQQESMSEDKITQLARENERLREANDAQTAQQQQFQIKYHENEVKLDSYMRDYDRLFEDNKRLRDTCNQLREEKENALGEISKSRVHQHNRINEISDECNMKVAHLEGIILDLKERHKSYEDKAYSVIISQEKVTEKWKDEHRKSVQYFERLVNQIQVENRMLQDQCVELKSKVRAIQKDHSIHDMQKIGQDRASKSKEKK